MCVYMTERKLWDASCHIVKQRPTWASIHSLRFTEQLTDSVVAVEIRSVAERRVLSQPLAQLLAGEHKANNRREEHSICRRTMGDPRERSRERERGQEREVKRERSRERGQEREVKREREANGVGTAIQSTSC